MKESRRAQRIKRHYHRMHKAGGLNLVSLMDIFTILVFFLMVNSSDVKVLQQESKIKLPVSSADQQPRETLVVTVTDTDIIVQGRAVAAISSIVEGAEIVPGLKDELIYQGNRSGVEIDLTSGLGGMVTIMGDKDIPYSLLKVIMNTCVDAKFTQISLAVSKAGKKEA
ncbi:MAG: biopolymer transporter ExbD [Hahellaceae bacterium]|nr:biopolymer transporter ExbD [Hahellaceae bacterium]MCP5212165.1 biopolymer transporter ExbD [Hahellaceae bacterium]